MHSRVYVCDEIGDLLVALTKCPNAPILIVDEIPGAIHVLIHVVISAPEVVPAHLDPLLGLADRQDPVRAALLALEMTTAVVTHAVIHVVEIVIVLLVVTMGIDPVATVIVARVVNLETVPLAILVAEIVTGLLAVMALTHVVILAVAIVRLVIVVRVVNMETVPSVVMIHAVIVLVATAVQVVIVRRAVISVIVPVVTAVQVVIVPRVVNMVTDRFVAMTAAVILAVATVIVLLVETLVTVIVHLVESLVIVTALRVEMIQEPIHVVVTETVRRVVMVQALVGLLVLVVMTAVMVVVAVDRVAKISHHADQRTKQNVVAKPCARAAAVKSVKTANRLRCHAKPRPGLMKVELKMKSAMPPKVLCAVGLHRDAPCRRDLKMKTN